MPLRLKLLEALAAVLAAGGLTVVARAEPASGPCRDLSRECVIEVAKTYIEAQVDYSKRDAARLAPNAHRWENGYSNGSNADEIRGGESGLVSIDRFLNGPRDTDRVLVDGNQEVFFWIIDAGIPGIANIATAHIAERFRVEEGVCGDGPSPCITEIEAIFCIGPRGDEAGRPSAEERPLLSNILCHRAG